MRVAAALPLLAALLLLPLPPSEAQRTKPPRPHIIFILADDMGFYDAPWHNPMIHAPTLRGLAEGGVTLEQSYMLPVCSPSRAALLSGKYPYTNGMMYKSIKPLQPTGLPLNLTLLPETMKGLGYTTHAIGKWHLGFCKDEYTPMRRGFDTFRGFYNGGINYYSHSHGGKLENRNTTKEEKRGRNKESIKAVGFDFRDNSATDDSKLGQYSTFEFTKNAQTLIRNNDPRVPMFMYLAFQNPHGPLVVPRKYMEMYPHEANPKRKIYMGMITALDDAVQKVLDTLKETGHYDNSIIVFSSDNGGAASKMGLNWPLRGVKGTMFEGGTRIPALIAGPLIHQHGTAYQGIFHATDWYPTLVKAAGGVPPTDLDGIDQWGALRGIQTPPRKQMIYHMTNKHSLATAMRYENYKILVGNFKDNGWLVPPEFDSIDKKLLLRFLDSGRAMNIAPSRPDSEHQSNNSTISDGLFYSHTSDMVSAENPNSDDYYYDGDSDEAPEEDDIEEPLEIGASHNQQFGNTESNNSSRTETSPPADEDHSDGAVERMQEALERNLAAQEEQYSVPGEGASMNPMELEMDKDKRRILKRNRDQKKREDKEQRKKSKREWKRQKIETRIIRPMELQPEKIQRVIGNKKRSIESFNSVESILESGIPIHLYDLKKDPYERQNIAAAQPEVLESLLHRLLPEIKAYVPPYDPPLTPRGQPSNFGGFWSPGWC